MLAQVVLTIDFICLAVCASVASRTEASVAANKGMTASINAWIRRLAVINRCCAGGASVIRETRAGVVIHIVRAVAVQTRVGFTVVDNLAAVSACVARRARAVVSIHSIRAG